MCYFFLLLMLTQTPTEPVVEVGKPMIAYTLPDQHGTSHTFTPGTRWVLVSFEKKTGAMVNRWLKAEPSEFLSKHHMDFVVEISPMPAIISKKFAMPKMRKYPHLVLVADDATYQQTFLKQDDHVTLFQLDEKGVVEAIHHLADIEEVQKLVLGS